MVAVNATSTMLTPIVGAAVPVCAVSRIAAVPASSPETANADAITVLALIPSTRAIRKSSAAARICVPSVVFRRKRPSATSSARVTPTMTTSSLWISIEPTENELLKPEAKSVVRGSEPHLSAARF